MKTPTTPLPELNKIRFELEVCRARIAIRDYFLSTTIKDVYENVGQVLSSVSFKLAAHEIKNKEVDHHILAETRELVGKSIDDLRQMTRRLHPDADIINKGGMVWALQYTNAVLGWPINIKKNETLEPAITDGIKLITFKILLDVLISIKQGNKNILEIGINYKGQQVVYSIFLDQENNNGIEQHLNLAIISPLLSMINATYSISNHTQSINISVPVKINFYE